MMVVGGGEADRYLEKSLQEMRRLTDDALICCNRVDKNTEAMISRFGFRWYRDDREWGVLQPKIKEGLLTQVQSYNPDWILAFDADEVFDKELTREGLELLASSGQVAWYFYIINLWNDPVHHRQDMAFWNVRFFKNLQPYAYEQRNVHCGIAPKWAYYDGKYAPYILKHYGLMEPTDRLIKVQRYARFDPDARYKDKLYYDALSSEISPEEFDEGEWHDKVSTEVKGYKIKPIKEKTMFGQEKKYVYLIRDDGSSVDIPEKALEETLKKHPTWKVERSVNTDETKNAVQAPEIIPDPLECTLCPFVGQNERAVRMHKIKKHA